MGMIVCSLVHHDRVKAPWLLVIAGTIIFFAAGIEEDANLGWLSIDVCNLIYDFGIATALAGAVTLERKHHIHAPALLRLLGDASYSIYLTYFSIMPLRPRFMPGVLNGRDRRSLPRRRPDWMRCNIDARRSSSRKMQQPRRRNPQ